MRRILRPGRLGLIRSIHDVLFLAEIEERKITMHARLFQTVILVLSVLLICPRGYPFK